MLIIVLHDPETTSSGSSLWNYAGVFTSDEMKVIRLAALDDIGYHRNSGYSIAVPGSPAPLLNLTQHA
jgi:hypothetical protein